MMLRSTLAQKVPQGSSSFQCPCSANLWASCDVCFACLMIQNLLQHGNIPVSFCELACGHIYCEGEDGATVITSPQDMSAGVKGHGMNFARHLAASSLLPGKKKKPLITRKEKETITIPIAPYDKPEFFSNRIQKS